MRVIHRRAPGTTGCTLTAQPGLLRPSTADLVDASFLAAACLLALAGFVTGFDGPASCWWRWSASRSASAPGTSECASLKWPHLEA